MSKNLSGKYYQENKERLLRKKKTKLMKDAEIVLKKKKKKSYNMFMNVTKISQKMKSKSLSSIEKNIIKRENLRNYEKVL